MDIEKLIERLRTESLYADKASLEIMDLCMEAATALSTLQIENQALRTAANGFKVESKKLRTELKQKSKLIAQQAAELERRDELLKEHETELEKVKAERDEAISTIFKWTGCPECKHWNSADEWCEKHDREADSCDW